MASEIGADVIVVGAKGKNAFAGLLVELHLAGLYWGDCSLSNILWRRDAGAMMAYLVDAERPGDAAGAFGEVGPGHDPSLGPTPGSVAGRYPSEAPSGGLKAERTPGRTWAGPGITTGGFTRGTSGASNKWVASRNGQE